MSVVDSAGRKIVLDRQPPDYLSLMRAECRQHPDLLPCFAAVSLHAHGWSLREIAQVCGCRQSSVHRRIHRLVSYLELHYQRGRY